MGCLLPQRNLAYPDKYSVSEVGREQDGKYSRLCGPDGLLHSLGFLFVYLFAWVFCFLSVYLGLGFVCLFVDNS